MNLSWIFGIGDILIAHAAAATAVITSIVALTPTQADDHALDRVKNVFVKYGSAIKFIFTTAESISKNANASSPSNPAS